MYNNYTNIYSHTYQKIKEDIIKAVGYNIGNILKNELKKQFGCSTDESKEQSPENITKIITENLKLHKKIYENVLSKLLNSKRFTKIIVKASLSESSRLSINTAAGWGKEIFEVGINIHPIYSVPFIPASSIKGAFRRALKNVGKYVISNDYEKLKALELVLLGSYLDDKKEDNKKENRKEEFSVPINKIEELGIKIREDDKKSIDKIAGRLIFLDSYPYKITYKEDKSIKVEEPRDILVCDIINKHYDENQYFKENFEKEDPYKIGEYISPNPVIFYTIKENTPFTFVFLVDKDVWNVQVVRLSIMVALEYLFKIIGLGAKTTYGYGRFKIDEIIII